MIAIKNIVENIVNDMKVILSDENIFFYVGRMQEIQSLFQAKSKSSTYRTQRLPAVCLVMEYKEKEEEVIGVKILFCTAADKEETTDKRYDSKFPALYDLKQAFDEAYGDSEYTENSYPTFTKTDSPYSNGNENIFSSPVDVLICEYDFLLNIKNC